jgi:hypothetical protein
MALRFRKITLMKIHGCLDTPTDGPISDGTDVSKLLMIGWLRYVQEMALFPTFTFLPLHSS